MIGNLARLFRVRLVLMNAVAALGGYLLGPGPRETEAMLLLGAGVSLLACGASALNQVLERDLDRLMMRTRRRPLVTGALTVATVRFIGWATGVAGFLLLCLAGGALPAFLGVAAFGWYLAVYTPLKRRTPFALAVGALSGALPPVIGWTVAGGNAADFSVLLLAVILYLWQVPHFWLLQRRHAEDYRRAGFPLFAPPAYGSGPAPLFTLWMLALAAAALMLPAFGVMARSAAPWCILFLVPLLITRIRRWEPALFAGLTLYPLLITLVLCAGR